MPNAYFYADPDAPAQQWHVVQAAHEPQPAEVVVGAGGLEANFAEGDLDDWLVNRLKKKVVKQEIENALEVPIDTFYGRATKQRHKKILDNIKETYPTKHKIDNDTLIGIEVEVENIPDKVDCTPVWAYKEDGSLRNNGIEYVSAPMEAQYVPSALSYLKHHLNSANNPEYTPRTSIHVHMNVQNMSFKQVQVFTLLYLCFESLLYSYAGNGRNKSIFCVPLSHAGYVGNLRGFFSFNDFSSTAFTEYFRHWHKYTGFNLHPVHQFGTVEFRHLAGTDDVEYISKWVSLILALKEAALVYNLEDLFKVISDLNTNSEYYIFASNIFKDSLQYVNVNSLQDTMEKDISHIKDCFFPNKQRTFDKEAFKTSYFYIRHKIKEVVKEVSKYDGMTLLELEKRLKELYTAYHASMKQTTRDKISIEYGEVQTAIKNKKDKENF